MGVQKLSTEAWGPAWGPGLGWKYFCLISKDFGGLQCLKTEKVWSHLIGITALCVFDLDYYGYYDRLSIPTIRMTARHGKTPANDGLWPIRTDSISRNFVKGRLEGRYNFNLDNIEEYFDAAGFKSGSLVKTKVIFQHIDQTYWCHGGVFGTCGSSSVKMANVTEVMRSWPYTAPYIYICNSYIWILFLKCRSVWWRLVFKACLSTSYCFSVYYVRDPWFLSSPASPGAILG